MAPLVAAAIFILTLVFILTNRLNHIIAALFGAVCMLAAGIAMGFYSESQAIASIEFDALGLLLGMMIMVSILQPTGFFQYVSIRAAQLSHGNPWRLMLLLGVGTSLISLVINNVTTVVIVGPVTILIAELLGFSPIPFLMAQALLSNTAGVGTSIGDPASVLVASASGYAFNDFLFRAFPIVAIVVLVSLLMFRVLFSRELSVRPEDPDVVAKLDAEEAIQDYATMRRVLIVLAVAIGLFFFQGWLRLSSGFIALSAAATSLAWVRPDIREVLERVDWSVLLFFIGFFTLVGGLEATGAFEPIILILSSIGRENTMVLGVILIWVVAGLSALVDNVPVTIAMITLVRGLAMEGIDVSALWWAVVLGAGFGGNATPIGSTTNIVIVSMSQRTHTPLTPKLWSRRGLPVAFTACVVGSILFALTFKWLGG
jgi:Na+/H+ antiporter NhaD/arsenite permease-like protein